MTQKDKKKKKLLYIKCPKCGGHTYLTRGGFYLCVVCGYNNLQEDEVLTNATEFGH